MKKPNKPSKMTHTSLVIQIACLNATNGEAFHGRWSRLKNTSILSRGGKMRARALLATDPTSEMRSPRSGIDNARQAAEWGQSY